MQQWLFSEPLQNDYVNRTEWYAAASDSQDNAIYDYSKISNEVVSLSSPASTSRSNFVSTSACTGHTMYNVYDEGYIGAKSTRFHKNLQKDTG